MAELLEDQPIERWDTSGGTLVSEMPTRRESVDPTPAPITHVPSPAETEPWEPLATETVPREYIESPEVPPIARTQRDRQAASDSPAPAELAAELEAVREAEQAEQEEFADIFLEQLQTIDSLDSILRAKAAEPTTTGTLYVQPRPAGTGTNYALLIGAGLGLWLLMKN